MPLGSEPSLERETLERETENLWLDRMQAARMDLVGRMSARLVHDLCQPLTSVLCNAEVARRTLLRPEARIDKLAEIIEDICLSAERAEELIRGQRDFLSKHGRAREVVSIPRLLEDAVALTRSEFRTRQIRLATHCALNVPTVLADSVQLQQVLVNLMLNAADAVMQRPPSERRIDMQARFLEPLIEISVQDNGQGVARVVPRVFDTTVSTKSGEMGLGLRICAEVIKAHDGEISAENNPQGGATFRVLLPAR